MSKAKNPFRVVLQAKTKEWYGYLLNLTFQEDSDPPGNSFRPKMAIKSKNCRKEQKAAYLISEEATNQHMPRPIHLTILVTELNLPILQDQNREIRVSENQTHQISARHYLAAPNATHHHSIPALAPWRDSMFWSRQKD